MSSRKPIAKQFTEFVRELLRDYRRQEINRIMLDADQRVTEANNRCDQTCMALREAHKAELAARDRDHKRDLDKALGITHQRVEKPYYEHGRDADPGPTLYVYKRRIPWDTNAYIFIPAYDRVPANIKQDPVYSKSGRLWIYSLSAENDLDYECVDRRTDGQRIFANFDANKLKLLTIRDDAAKVRAYTLSRINLDDDADADESSN
jgi:hypothetical protein